MPRSWPESQGSGSIVLECAQVHSTDLMLRVVFVCTLLFYCYGLVWGVLLSG